jgi:hypothetical protein
MTRTQRLSMLAFSSAFIYSARGNKKLKHDQGTARVSYHSTNILWAKPKYA